MFAKLFLRRLAEATACYFMAQDPEVLVVGAGPVGLLAALRLRERGVHVTVIDQEPRIAGHSYACALHPQSLKLLDELGLAAEAMRKGRSLHSLAFYDGTARKAEVHFTDLPLEFPFVLVLSQSALEELLERALAKQGGVQVRWNHRLSDLRCNKDAVVATIEKLVEPAPGCILPDLARAVTDKCEEPYRFVIGADGQNSFVRERLQIDYDSFGEAEAFVVYEFATDADLPHEVRVVLDERSVNVMWPLADNRCRWSFQLSPAEVLGETKGSRPLATKPPEMEKALIQHARMLLQQRAPWFEGTIKDITWWAGASFERRLAAAFGRGRCWLAGDAAHRTSPVGVQSLNLGLQEAVHLAVVIARILRGEDAPELLVPYDATHRQEWTKLLKPDGVEHLALANSWVASRRNRIVPCIPASGYQLEILLKQLGLHG